MTEWYKSIPTFHDQKPCSLENFDKNNKFEDDDFKPSQESFVVPEKIKTIVDKQELQLAKTNIKWKRISDFEDFDKYDLFPPELNCDNFEQGFFGDCYFLSMVALISNYGDLLKRLFPIGKNPFGYYEVLLFINGWKRVIIDDYIPYYTREDKIYYLTSQSKKYENCFYHMLLEKAWAKVNKMYFNINGGLPINALTVLTGFKSECLNLKILKEDEKKDILDKIKNGINKDGFIFGVSTENHSYSLLDVEKTKLDDVYIIKVRNPHGIIGGNLAKNLNDAKKTNLLKMFFNKVKEDEYTPKKRYFVEHELESRFENFTFPEDTGIFYISSTYFFDFFYSCYTCYNMFGAFVIEYSFNFFNFFPKSEIDLKKKFYNFKVKAKSNSVVQFNLTNHTRDHLGRMEFHSNMYEIYINGKRLKNFNKLEAKKEYFICWNYEHKVPKDDILFWIPFKGNIEVEFLGLSEYKKTKDDGVYIKKGFILNINKYKVTEKLGEYYRRRAEMVDLVEKGFGKKLISDVEEKGFNFEYIEDYDDTVAITYITNVDDPNDRDILSQNLVNRNLIFKGKNAFRRRIIGESEILIKEGNNYTKQYKGLCYYNLFNQYPHEENKNNILIEKLLKKRLNLACGKKEERYLRIISLKGPFAGQKKFECHTNNHYLSNLLTDRKMIICNCCEEKINSNSFSFFCSECNFSHCEKISCRQYRNKIKKKDNFCSPYANYLIKTKQHNHRLIKCIIEEPNNVHRCFNCLKKLSELEKIYYCTSCDFRLCEKCEINEKCGKPWQFHCCWHEHPLTLCNTEGRKNIKDNNEIKERKKKEEEKEEEEEDFLEKEVYSAGKTIQSGVTQTMVITEDDLDKNKENNKPKDKSYLVLKEKIDYYKGPSDEDFYFRCNHCGTQYLRTNEVLYCTICDFYICIKCQINYSQYIGREEENIVPTSYINGEVLPVKCRCFIGSEKTTESKCLCGKKLKLENWNYYCSFCDGFFCDECYSEHRVLFKNNISIFDGNVSGNCYFGNCYKRNNEFNYSGTWENNINEELAEIPHLKSHKNSYKKINFNDEAFCDICSRKCNLYDEGYSCSKCGMNICINCVIDINIRHLKTEKHEHKLNIDKCTKETECTICEKTKKGIFFFCSICNSDQGIWKTYVQGIKEFYCCLQCFKLPRYNKYL